MPFAYFLWKSLTLRIGDTWPMLIWPFAFAAAAINLAEIGKEQRSNWILRTAEPWARAAIVLGVVLNVAIFYYYAVSNFAVRAEQGPDREGSGLRRDRRAGKSRGDKVGATWIATLDYRIYAELRWHLKDSIPVVQVNERKPLHRLQGFGERGHETRHRAYVDSAPNDGNVNDDQNNCRIASGRTSRSDMAWR